MFCPWVELLIQTKSVSEEIWERKVFGKVVFFVMIVEYNLINFISWIDHLKLQFPNGYKDIEERKI